MWLSSPLFAQDQARPPLQEAQAPQSEQQPASSRTSQPTENNSGGESGSKFRNWKDYLIGTGGSVGALWSFGSGFEYSLFRDDANHEITISADFFNDRTSFAGQKLLVPILANHRWFIGPEPFKGIFINAGLGEAIPFGRDHGSGSFAWEGGIGAVFSKKITLELRYIGRRSQQVSNGASTFTTNNAFIGAQASINLF